VARNNYRYRLAFGSLSTSARYCVNLPSADDLELAEDELATQIEQEVRRVDHHQAVSVK
jgi:hypothetical protein